MPFGAFAPFPFRLGGSPEEGLVSSQHARLVADMVALVRSMPLAVLTVNKVGSTVTIESYHGQNGIGLAHAPTAAGAGTGLFTLTWDRSFPTDRYQIGINEAPQYSWTVRTAFGSSQGTVNRQVTCEVTDGVVSVGNTETGTFEDGRVTVEVWGDWLPLPQIGSYGGDPNKEDSVTEGVVPYAAVIYTDLQGMRGSAYTTEKRSLVHAENLALARLLGYFSYRLPEKVRANAVPSRSDERLPYWVTVLGEASRPDDEKWLLRQRASVAYRAATGPLYDTVQATLQDLLGDNYVTTHLADELPLSTPPTPTCWPGIDPGASTYSIGGGAWYSRRSHLVVQVQLLPGQSTDDFLRLVNVDLFTTLDRLLPAWMTFSWTRGTSFLLDISQLDFDGVSDA